MLETTLRLKQRYAWLESVSDFAKRVGEAHQFAYLLRSAPDEMRLRMEELMWRLPPELKGPDVEDDDWLLGALTRAPGPVVEHVVQARRTILQEHGSFVHPDIDGRLVGILPDESLSDGAATPESNNFLDDDNIPAWNYWLAVAPHDETGHPLLVAYVPSAFVEPVHRGISVNPEECIFWL